MPTSTTDASDGFTLIEALCALAILALGLVALFQAMGGATRGSKALTDRLAARIVMQSLVADAALTTAPLAVPRTGRTNGYDWSIATVPATDELAVGGSHSPWRLYRVVLAVKGPGGVMQLDRLKLMAAR